MWSWGVVLDRSMVCYRTMVCCGAMVCNRTMVCNWNMMGNWMGGWGGVLDCLGGQKQQRGENLHKKHLDII